MRQDMVLPFQIETQAARGRLVRLGTTVDRMVSHRGYPLPVATLLGELTVLAALVSLVAQDRGPAHGADQGRRCRRRACRRCDLGRGDSRFRPVRRRGARPERRLERLARRPGAQPDRRGPSRLHRRPGRGPRALSGNRRARGTVARRMRPGSFLPVRSEPGRVQARHGARRRRVDDAAPLGPRRKGRTKTPRTDGAAP